MRSLLLVVGSLIFAAPHLVLAQQNSVAADPCARYQWDISRERTLFAAAPTPVAAAKEVGSSPSTIATDRAYRVQLAPAAQVVFAAAPGKASPAGGSYAGMLAFKVPVAGNYRVAVDMPMWLDVVADTHLVPAADYEGQHDCAAPRKIVQFSLEANKLLILQMSGVSEASARVTIVRASAD